MNREVFVRRTCIAFVLLLLSTALITFAAGYASADDLSASVSGKVVDSDGNALSGINVALENGTSVNTDSLGNFMIMCTPGEHTLTFSGSDIDSRDMMINVGDSGLAMGNVWTTESSAAADMTMTIVMIIAGLAVTGLIVFLYLRKKKKA
ncbi:MAG: carboxypeptidase-like regulatory domain-containing protein [Methanomassiliicoccales archaeon]|nr:carboxypeptidase-like regulatory domain-containing protein [Methanomassiliicoccales archaeon]